MNRLSRAGAFAAVFFLAALPFVRADDPKKDNTHQGIVVKAGDGQLTMTDMNGKNEHTHPVAQNALIYCDEKQCKLEELPKGCTVKVTLESQEDKMVATRIVAKKYKPLPPK